MEAYLKFADCYIRITGNHDYIDSVNFVKKAQKDDYTADSMVFKAREQLQEYLLGKRQTFTLNLKIIGTTFEKSVYHELLQIPYNHLLSYKEIAFKLNNPKAARAVGNANNKNNLAIIIPCHRVIASDGRLSGYGAGVAIKAKLIELERNNGGYHG